MLDKRSLKLDLVALGLSALAVFLGLALWTYDPADPPSALVYPPHAHTANACGRSGALAADVLLHAFGLGAYYLVLSLAVLDVALLTRRQITDPVLRGIGWALSLVGFTALFAMALPRWSPGPVIGSGGYLGATGRGLLEMNFAAAGAYILATSLIAGGLLLCTDYVLIRIVARLLGLPLGGFLRAGLAVAPRMGTKPNRSTAAAVSGDRADNEVDEDEKRLAVRICGKGNADDLADRPEPAKVVAEKNDEADQDADESQTDSDAEDAETADAAKSSVGERLANALRIKPPRRSEREAVMKELDEASRTEETRDYELPSIDMLLEGEPISFEEHEKEVRRKAKILEKSFASFGFKVKVVEIETGPVIAQFEVELESGLRLSKITSLADDLAIALRVPSVRIVAPIPGKNTVGIEVPNAERQLVRLREVIEEANGTAQKMRIPIYLGKDVSGKSMVVDLTTLPHLLIAGRTGTGKSVCLNSIIVSMLMTRRPDEVRMLMIDPKMVELSPYKRLPHLMHPVVTDMRKAEAILAWAVEKMEERYALLANAGVRHIGVYNQLGEEELMDRLQPGSDEERKSIPLNLPYIVIVADEMADLMMTSAKEVEQHIIRLAQKSRAVGIHLVLATQKPTVDVITGLIKSNLPARIAFQVASRTDSRVVLDEMGADKLLGNGDMLFLWPGTSTLLRGQGTYVSDDEINKIVEFVGTTEPQFVKELVQLKAADPAAAEGSKLPSRDDLYEAAVDVVVREGRGSVSLLQRALGIGYGRAARLIDYMAEDGLVGTYNGSQAREVLISLAQWDEMQGQQPAGAAPPSGASPPRQNRVLAMAPPHGEEGDDEQEEDDVDESSEVEDDDAFDEADSDEAPFDDEEVGDIGDDIVDEDTEAHDEPDPDEKPAPRFRRNRYNAESA